MIAIPERHAAGKRPRRPLLVNTGRHCADRPPLRLRLLAWLLTIFRRLLAARRRKPAVPAALPTAGAAMALDTGQLAKVHPREHLSPERPTTLQRPDGQIVIDEYHHVEVCPWPAAGRPGFPAPAEGWRADDTRYDLPVARPYAPLNGNDQTRELYFAPVFGQAPVARVLEAERLAGELIT